MRERYTPTVRGGATCGFLLTTLVWIGWMTPPPALAVTADDVKCKGCVGKKDLDKGAIKNKNIKKNSITSKRIKNRTLEQSHLSDDLLALLTVADFYVVDANDAVVGALFGDNVLLLRHPSGGYREAQIDRGDIYSGSTSALYFSQPGCTGKVATEAYTRGSPPLIERVGIIQDPVTSVTTAYVRDSTATPEPFEYVSVYRDVDNESYTGIEPVCSGDDGTLDDAVPMVKDFELDPFASPYRIVPAAEAANL